VVGGAGGPVRIAITSRHRDGDDDALAAATENIGVN
jgi:hypothetical protein